MEKKRIYFLVNPIAGGKKKDNFRALVQSNIDANKFDYEIKIWEKSDNVVQLLQNAVQGNFDIIIAAGGDGTLNLVASQVVNTGKIMGLIPFGSGNGFARHNNIPLQADKAIQRINDLNIKKVDTLLVNNHRFVNVAGVGFDAHIGYLFSIAPERGFKTYAKIVMRELGNFKPQTYVLNIDGKEYKEDAFLISVANASQWGNNATIAPGASTRDGLMDIVVMKPFKFYQVPQLVLQMFSKNINKNRLIKSFKATNLTLRRNEKGAVHYDGEPMEMGTEINFKIDPASLNLLV